jgi:hypothetical protein
MRLQYLAVTLRLPAVSHGSLEQSGRVLVSGSLQRLLLRFELLVCHDCRVSGLCYRTLCLELSSSESCSISVSEDDDFQNPQHWRNRAEETRAKANDMHSPELKERMFIYCR